MGHKGPELLVSKYGADTTPSGLLEPNAIATPVEPREVQASNEGVIGCPTGRDH